MLNVKDNGKAQPNIKCPQCMVQIQGTAVNILVDSGSPYTIIPNELYENLFADIKLCDSDIAPGGYVGTPIEMRGFFQATIQYKARKTEERVYVSMHGATILGWPTQAKLKIILDPAQIQPVLQTTPSVVDRFEDVFDQSNNHRQNTSNIKYNGAKKQRQYNTKCVTFLCQCSRHYQTKYNVCKMVAS